MKINGVAILSCLRLGKSGQGKVGKEESLKFKI